MPQIYRAKFFGNTSVSEPRGDFICESSLGLLKTQLLTSKLHKKRIRIRVDTSGISVIGSRNSVSWIEFYNTYSDSFVCKK